MARVTLPKSSLRARRRRRRFIILVALIAGVLLVVGVFAGLSYVPFLRVTTIAVSGTQTLATSTLDAATRTYLRGGYGYLFSKSNIFLYPKHTLIEELLKTFPSIKNVDIQADDFHTISVHVTERAVKALRCSAEDGSCQYMDEDGVVYGEAPTFSEPIYVSYIDTVRAPNKVPFQYLSIDEFHNLSALVDALSQTETLDPVHRVEVDSHGDVTATFKGGFKLLFALKDASGDVFERYGLAKKSDPFVGKAIEDFQYLDLRFGDKLYYKVKDE